MSKRSISKKRLEMGEEAWAEYQTDRQKIGSSVYWSTGGEKVINWRRNTKSKLIAYKGGKCEVCGYDKDCPAAYDFHHRDPEEKDFSISRRGHTRSFDSLKQEVDKCQLLCCRCHREIHQKEYDKIREEKRLIKESLKINKKCLDCQKDFTNKGKICLECKSNRYSKYEEKRRSINRPTKEQLEKDVWEYPTYQLAKMYNVADSAINKWCKKFGIEKPPRGYWQKKKRGKI